MIVYNKNTHWDRSQTYATARDRITLAADKSNAQKFHIAVAQPGAMRRREEYDKVPAGTSFPVDAGRKFRIGRRGN
jgi:hypothetical protein